MENSNNETPEIHPNDKNDIGSGVNSGGKHGADRQLKGNEDKPEIAPLEKDEPEIPTQIPAPVTPEYNGNNSPDANKTPDE